MLTTFSFTDFTFTLIVVLFFHVAFALIVGYRKISDSSRVPYTSRAPDTGRGSSELYQ